MRSLTQLLALSLMATPLLGCRDNSPPTPVVPPPPLGQDTQYREVDYPKPLPQQQAPPVGAAPFYDEPLLVDQPPEAKAFVETYRKVGRPRIVVFVNRTLEGQILPTTDTGGTIEPKQTNAPYLQPGEYDAVNARSIDYGLMETLLADWMGADGKVTIISPTLVRKKLTDQQIRDLQSGRPQVLAEIAEGLDADILIQLQTRPTKQTPRGLDVRILAEAMNVRGGESLARAAVDLEPPLDKIQVNTYTRFIARKLMDGMVQTWNSPPPAREEVRPAPVEPKPEVKPEPGPEQPRNNGGGLGPRLRLPPATQNN